MVHGEQPDERAVAREIDELRQRLAVLGASASSDRDAIHQAKFELAALLTYLAAWAPPPDAPRP